MFSLAFSFLFQIELKAHFFTRYVVVAHTHTQHTRCIKTSTWFRGTSLEITIGLKRRLKACIMRFDLIDRKESSRRSREGAAWARRKREERRGGCGHGMHREAKVGGGINVTNARYFPLRWSRDAREEPRFGCNDELFPASTSAFLSLSIVFLKPSSKFRLPPSPRAHFYPKVAPIISIIKARYALRGTAMVDLISPSLPSIFPDSFLLTLVVVGTLSDQPPTAIISRHRRRGSWPPRRWNFRLVGHWSAMYGDRGDTSLSTRMYGIDGKERERAFVIVGNKSRRSRLPSKCMRERSGGRIVRLKGTSARERRGLTKLRITEGRFSTTCFAATVTLRQRDARNIRRLRVNYAARSEIICHYRR